MTLMLASVTGPDEAEVAVTAGADIVDCKDPSQGALGALPPQTVREIVDAVAGRRRTSAVTGDLPMEPERVVQAAGAMAATGVGFVKVGLFPGDGRPATIKALGRLAARVRLVGVLFADRDPDISLLPLLARVGFHGAMIDTAAKGGGGLLSHLDPAALTAFLSATRAQGLTAGLAGGLKAADVPALLRLGPDFLGFRGALCAGHEREGRLDPAAAKAIRDLIPLPASGAGEGNVDYRLLAARGYAPAPEDRQGPPDRIFVNNLVLRARVGADGSERPGARTLSFDVAVDVARPPPVPSDGREALSHETIVRAVRSIAAAAPIDRIERLAEQVAAAILDHPRARRVWIKVEMLEMDRGSLGVEIVREAPGTDDAAPTRPAHPTDGRPKAGA